MCFAEEGEKQQPTITTPEDTAGTDEEQHEINSDRTQDMRKWSDIACAAEEQEHELTQMSSAIGYYSTLQAPPKRCPLPMRALKSRLHSHSSPPTWAAWLPKGLQEAHVMALPETSSAYSSCEDAPPTILSNMTYVAHDACMPGMQEPMIFTSVAYANQDATTPATNAPIVPINFTSTSQDATISSNHDHTMLANGTCVSQSGICDPMEIADATCSNQGGTQESGQWVHMGFVPVMVPVESLQGGCDGTYWQDGSNGAYWQDGSDGMYCAQVDQAYVQDESVNQDYTTVGQVIGKVWKLSRTARGCRQVQDAFEEGSPEQIAAMTSELKGHVWEALKCQHGNHVLQKVIAKAEPEAVQFVIDELMQYGPASVGQAARHRFGCRIMERLIENCGTEQMAPMVEVLLADSVALSSHSFGNFVMLHLLTYCGSDVVSHIASALEENLSTIPVEGHAGEVIAKALAHSTDGSCSSLAATLLEDSDRVAAMACSRWGHLAVKHAMQLVDDSSRHRACTEVLQCSAWLRYNRYGRGIANFAMEQQNMQCICAN